MSDQVISVPFGDSKASALQPRRSLTLYIFKMHLPALLAHFIPLQTINSYNEITSYKIEEAQCFAGFTQLCIIWGK